MSISADPKYVVDFWARSKSDILASIKSFDFPSHPEKQTFSPIPISVLSNPIYRKALETEYASIAKVCDKCDFDNGLEAAVYNSRNNFLKVQLKRKVSV